MNKVTGFSLVEVLVSTLIIVLGMTGFVSMQTEYVVASKNLSLRYQGAVLLEEKLNELRFFIKKEGDGSEHTYQDIKTNLGGLLVSGEHARRLSAVVTDMHTYTLSWVVNNLYAVDDDFDGIPNLWVTSSHPLFVSEPLAHLKRIRLKVEWADTRGEPQQLVVTTYLAPTSLQDSHRVITRHPSSHARLE